MNGKALGNRKTAILADLVRNTQCFGLESGPIEDTCDLIESLVAEPAADASNVVSANGESGTEKGISVQLRLTSDDRQRAMRLERATSGLEDRM